MSSKLIGQGWPFPVRPDADGRLRLRGGVQKVRDSIWLILSTARGERIMRPGFGVGLQRAVFSPNDPRQRARMAELARRALIRYEPRIDVLEVRADADPDEESRVLLHIDYRLRVNNAVYNLVFPYYLTEGAS